MAVQARLNVGGQVFETLLKTLEVPGSRFEEDNVSSFVQSAGVPFYDRDPRYFQFVLNYLRTKKVIVEDSMLLEGVLEEAEFFKLPELAEAVRARIAARDGRGRSGPSSVKQAHPAPSASTSATDLTRDQIVWICSSSDRRSFRGLRLDGVDLTKMDLVGANFCKCSLRGAKFADADLIHARFNDADLTGADFTGANMPFVVFQDACLRGAVLSRTNVHGARFDRADCEGAVFEGSTLHKAKFNDANLKGADIKVIDTGVGRPDYTGAIPAPLISVTDDDPGYLTD
eukprot:tig00000802_g4274.t1